MEVVIFLIGIVIITILICHFSLKGDIQKLDGDITKLKSDIENIEVKVKHIDSEIELLRSGIGLDIKREFQNHSNILYLDDNSFKPPFNIE